MTDVYVSSSFVDLKAHRQAVLTVLRGLHVVPHAMEDYVAADETSLDYCLRDVEKCQIFVGIYAWRYGAEVPSHNASITELEYRHAVTLGIPRLIFLLEPAHPWPPNVMDEGRPRERIMALRAELAGPDGRLCSMFTTPDDLAAKVGTAVTNELARLRAGTAGGDPPDHVAQYRARVRDQRRRLDLSALALPDHPDDIEVTVADVFVEQLVREEPPPPVELPRDWLRRMQTEGQIKPGELPEHIDASEADHLRELYLAKPWQRLFDVLSDTEHRKVVLLGDPGSGKSTVTNYLMLVLSRARRDERLSALTDVLPFVVELRSYSAMLVSGECESFVEYLAHQAARDGLGLPEAVLRQYLADNGRALFIFDGLDEIFDRNQRTAVTARIAAFVEEFPSVRVLVTSRVIGYVRKALTDAGFAHFTLQDLGDEQIQDFLARWYRHTMSDDESAGIRRLRLLETLRLTSAIRELAGNPLLLTILAIISRHKALPRERWNLYNHAAGVLVDRWDVNRQLGQGDTAAAPGTAPGNRVDVNADEKKAMLRRLAWEMQFDSSTAVNYIHGDELRAVFVRHLVERFGLDRADASAAADRIIDRLHMRNFILSRYGPDLYGFAHRTFLDFFCAAEIRHRFKTGLLTFDDVADLFRRHWPDTSWHEVLRLVASVLPEAGVEQIVDMLVTDADPQWPPQEFLNPPWNIALAVQCLAELRSRAAVEQAAAVLLDRVVLLLEHCVSINDRDTAQLIEDAILPAVRTIGPDWPGRRSFFAWYRRRGSHLLCSPVTEYAARIAAILAEPEDDVERLFTEELDPVRDSRASHAAVAGLAELARRCRLPERVNASYPEAGRVRGMLIERAGSGPYGQVRVAAVQALGEHFGDDPAAVAALNRLARDDRSGGIRTTAIRALRPACATDPATLRTVMVCTGDDHVPARQAAVELVGWRCGTSDDLVAALRRRLRVDTDPQVVKLAAQALVEHHHAGDLVRDDVVQRLAAGAGPAVRRAAIEVLAECANTRDILLGYVRTDPDAGVFRAAAEALADDLLATDRGAGDPEAAAQVRDAALARLPARGNPDPAVRLAAAEILGARFIGEEVVAGALRDEMSDAVPAVRIAAAHALAGIASTDGKVAIAMQRKLNDPEAEVRRIAVGVLLHRIALDADLRTKLTERARFDTDAGVRLAIVTALGRRWSLGPQARRLIVERVADDHSELVRRAAAEILAAHLDDPDARDALGDRIRADLDGDVVRIAAEAMGAYQGAGPRVARILVKRTGDRNANAKLRRTAVELLGDRFGDRDDTRDALLERISTDSDADVIETAAEILLRRAGGGPALEAQVRDRLLVRLDDAAPVNGGAARVLGRLLGAEPDLPARLIALSAAHPADTELCRVVGTVLAELPETSPQIHAWFVEHLDDPDWTVKEKSVRALGHRFGAQQETRALLDRHARHHPDGAFREVIGQVLTGLPEISPHDLPPIPLRRTDERQ
ncbi:HEAT repeat domain-containing protein [Dactylosporangium sp. CA-152071]|uniref:HEAT repeat domain-containing protein n=1 Tax=Dactylosporangium sp. CA-152071 TaxID=3239933 RepID=UPI003D93650F